MINTMIGPLYTILMGIFHDCSQGLCHFIIIKYLYILLYYYITGTMLRNIAPLVRSTEVNLPYMV